LDSPQAWTAQHPKAGEWWQMDVGSVKKVLGVVTQARSESAQRVTSYTVQVSSDGKYFEYVDGGVTFQANRPGDDDDFKVKNFFANSVETRFVKIVVKSWSTYISMRAAVLVQKVDDPVGHLLMWFDAKDSSSVITNTGNKVKEWKDKSGNNRHLQQGSASRQPTLEDSGFINFGPGLKVMKTKKLASGLMTNPVHTMCRVNFACNQDVMHVFDGFMGSTLAFFLMGTKVGAYQGIRHLTDNPDCGTDQIIEIVFNGGATKTAIDGGSFNVGNDGDRNDARGLTVGDDGHGREAYAADFKMSAILLFKGELSAASRKTNLNLLKSMR